MQNLFAKLHEPPSIAEQLKIIRRNLASRYVNALALHDIADISQLVSMCRRYDEATQYNSKNLKVDCLEADLAVLETKKIEVPKISQIPKPVNTPSRKSSLICWNCSKTGHAYRECRLVRKRFCFKCGKPDVTVKTCPCKQKN